MQGHGPVGPHPEADSRSALPTRDLLRLLLDHMARGPHPRHVDLDVLCEQVLRLDPEHGARIELLAAPLRGPLQALLASVGADGQIGKPQRADLRTVLRRMHCIVENVTSHHPLAPEHLQVHYARVDLAELVLLTTAAFEPLAVARNVAFDVNAPAHLVAEVDAEKIEAVVATLLFNAFKHTPEGGSITCNLEQDVHDGYPLLRVSDGGPTIPPAAAEAMFDRMREGDRGSALRLEGLVLNLGTARDFVALHGGTLAIVQRCTFRALLPSHALAGVEVGKGPAVVTGRIAESAAAVAERELRHEATLATEAPTLRERGVVLIVGSDRSVHRLVAASLDGDYEATSAFDANEGLRRAVAVRPDLIVTDIGVAGAVGEALIAGVRQQADLAHIPILVLTGAADPMLQVRLLEGGAQDVLRKPFLLPELRARVRNLVSTQRALSMLSGATIRREADLVKLAEMITNDQRALRSTLEQLQVARELAENANRIKGNFLRMVTHELKTPITALQLHLRLLERDPSVVLSEKVKQGLGHIERSSLRLLHLVDTVLEWARVESGRCEVFPEEFALPEVLAEVVFELQRYAEQKGVVLIERVRGAPLPLLTNDRRLVRLVVLNLLTRALQVTEHGTVEVELSSTGDEHRVCVRDHGPTIPADDRAEIFEPLGFDRDVRWREGGGSGLGLCVVRDIARALDANLVLEPAEGPGNTITLQLPPLRAERATGTFTRPTVLEEPSETAGTPVTSTRADASDVRFAAPVRP